MRAIDFPLCVMPARPNGLRSWQVSSRANRGSQPAAANKNVADKAQRYPHEMREQSLYKGTTPLTAHRCEVLRNARAYHGNRKIGNG